jgi:hypothetical protein
MRFELSEVPANRRNAMNPLTRTLAVTALLFAAAPALAHTDEYLATQKAPHGGQLRMSGPYHLELVVAKDSRTAKENAIAVYVTDHAGTPIDTNGGSGSVMLLGGGNKASVTLAPAGGNALKGTATYASSAALKAIVTIKLPGTDEAQARFTPLAPVVTPKAGHDHAAHH